MKRLVSKFQQRLGISRGEAIRRVTIFCFFGVAFVAIIALAILFAPYHGFTEKTPLLPGDHILVEKILDGDCLVSEADWLRLAEGSTTFVSGKVGAIVYMTKVDGIVYRYDQAIPDYFRYRIASQKVSDGMFVRELVAYKLIAVVAFVLMPIALCGLLGRGMRSIQQYYERSVW